MTGAEHYAEAERHMGFAAAIETDGDQDSTSAWHQRQAQVHATLALADAHLTGVLMYPEDRDAWDRATGRLQDSPAVTP